MTLGARRAGVGQIQLLTTRGLKLVKLMLQPNVGAQVSQLYTAMENNVYKAVYICMYIYIYCHSPKIYLSHFFNGIDIYK